MTVLDNGIVIDESTWNSPNFTPSALVLQVYGLPRDIDSVTFHHWNDPALNPTFEATATYLSRPAGNTSAHFVVQGGRVACLVSPENAAWHAGAARGNATSIGIEMSPWATDADMETGAALVRWLEKAYGKSLYVYRHMDWSATGCPGRYTDRIGELVNLANTGAKSSTPATTDTPGGMVMPVDGYTITQAFNGGRDLATNLGGGHTGTDFGTPIGTPVKAVANGTVVWEDWAENLPTTSWADRWYLVGGGYGGLTTDAGITVVIDHGGYLSIYSHLNETHLHKGDTIRRGEVLGKTGATGYTLGAHLHFEILPKPFAWSNGFYGRVDPVAFIQARPTTAGNTTSTSTMITKDWLDMASKDDVKNAIREVFSEQWERQGPRAAKIWNKGQTTSFATVLKWTDEAWLHMGESIGKVADSVTALGKRLDALEAKPTGAAAKGSTVVSGVTVEQLRAIVREEIDRTKLGAK